MYILKAFAEHDFFISNEIGITSEIGELSTQALTYAKDKGLYKSSLSANINLTTFKSAIDAVPYIMTTDLVDDVIRIIKYIYDNSQSGIVQKDVFLLDLLTNFTSIANNFACGDNIAVNNNIIPEWVSWQSLNVGNIGIDNSIKIWLSDASFRSQYDEYEIIIVPPIVNMDTFFTGATNVAIAVNAVKADEMMVNVQIAKNNCPESLLISRIFNYIDPLNPITNQIPTIWNILIYGLAGNNDIIIQNTIIEYILANSTKSQLQWTPLFPDIFKHTEFTILPEWNSYSIPNRTLEAGIYSPIVNVQSAINNYKAVVVVYPVNHIDTNIAIMSQPYKALSLLVVGGPDNKNSFFKITDVFSDFIDVSSTSIDFNRMSLKTQGWATLLANMIFIAESMTINTSVPSGMSKVTRDGILYLVCRYDYIDYLVASKLSFN